MRIEKVKIFNYKCFKKFSLEFNEGLNVIVGNNEAGKSTILEAINLALTGILKGSYLRNEISQYLFNMEVVDQFLKNIEEGKNPLPPEVGIEIFFAENDGGCIDQFKGNYNIERNRAAGIVFKIEFDEDYQGEYEKLIVSNEKLDSIPIEYYKVTWKTFSRETISTKIIPIKALLIDSNDNKCQNGSDVYISRIIKNILSDEEKVGISQAYCKMKEAFINDQKVNIINKKLKANSRIMEKQLNISTDLPAKHSWETHLMTYLESIPFHQIGKGKQCIIKTNLALSHRKNLEASLLLLEEPENHLSYSNLKVLLKNILKENEQKQIIVTTHSSHVANQFGLDKLILLHDSKTATITDLPSSTFNFFKKLPRYETLRLLLCQKAVLIEKDSNKLIFQRAYRDKNNGRLPIEDGIDVISVESAFKYFLDIAKLMNKSVAAITDNHDDYYNQINKTYKDFKDVACISIFADKRNDLKTLESQMIDANKKQLGDFCKALEIDSNCALESVLAYMSNNRTEWALKIFESSQTVHYPQYIIDAVGWCNEQ